MIPLLVLRPEPGAGATAAAARERGLHPLVAPLFAIRAVAPDLSGLRDRPDALLFTSANAVRALGDRSAAWREWPVYAVGAATAAAARAAGFATVTAGASDAAAILARAAADGCRHLLHLAGREHRAADHPDIRIDRVVCYAADPVEALPPAVVAAAAGGAVALLHSPRAAETFGPLLDRAGVARRTVALAALSPAVAVAAGPGWRAVRAACRVDEAALLAVGGKLCEEIGREA